MNLTANLSRCNIYCDNIKKKTIELFSEEKQVYNFIFIIIIR